jgi:hypothetical protein
VRRSLVVVENYLIDCLEWESEAEHELALPLHGVDLVDDHGLPVAREAARISGGDAKEDGFGFLRDTQRVFARDGALVRLRASRDGIGNAGLDGWISAPAGTRWERALAPDVPSRPGLAPMMLLRAAGRHGRLLGVWSWRGAVVSTDISDTMVALRLADGRRDEHTFTTDGWRIERERPGRCDIVVLGGFADDSVRNTPLPARAGSTDVVVPAPASLPAMIELGEEHYRRSEPAWHEAGEPRASVRLSLAAPRDLSIELDVAPSHRLFVPSGAVNRLDNEPAAINGDGVQLYVVAGERRGGWLLVPVEGSTAVTEYPIEGWENGLAVEATWRATPRGWSLAALIPLPAEARDVLLDVLVNEAAPNRERRRGQLVLSGARGEFVYLRGDRHDGARLLRFTLPDA